MSSEEPLELFVDYNLGKRFVEALRSLGDIPIHAHCDHFAQDEADTVWLEEVGRRGWFVITKDKNIRLRFTEREALREANVGAFFITSGNLASDQMIEIVTRALPRIKNFARNNTRPFIAVIRRDGTLEKLPCPQSSKS